MAGDPGLFLRGAHAAHLTVKWTSCRNRMTEVIRLQALGEEQNSGGYFYNHQAIQELRLKEMPVIFTVKNE